MSIHKPVLIAECIDLLDLRPGMTVVDATLGGGGHAHEILKRILPGGRLVAIDRDPLAIASARENFKSNLEKENVYLVNDNFSRLEAALDSLKIKKVDAILADLGLSSDQMENSERGFSFQKVGLLDMRMGKGSDLTAAEVVKNYSEDKLIAILRDYSDERYARPIAKKIVSARRLKPIRTTQELVEIIASAVPKKYLRDKIHFATKTFQALRMEVNKEKESLERLLNQAFAVLKPGGRLVVISFHSGEDRIVKNIFRENARGRVLAEDYVYGRREKPLVKVITKKPILPSPQEILSNPRARSAKLRTVEKMS